MAFDKVAKVYDEVIGAEYKDWSKDIINIIKKYSPNAKTLLDIGCGTGGHLKYLEKKYECTGIDKSKEMIALARKKTKSKLLVQDMTALDAGKFDVAICLYDSLNNLTEKDLKKAFGKIRKSTNLFIFDILTEKSMREMNNFQIQAGHTGKYSYIWENTYKNGVWEWTFTVFEPTNEHYTKHVAKNKEYYHSLEKIKRILKESGFEILDAHDTYTMEPVNMFTDRITVIAK